MRTSTLTLPNDFTFSDLFTASGLARLDQRFIRYLTQQDALLSDRLSLYRQQQLPLTPIETSEFLINCARYLESFLSEFFAIEEAVAICQARTTSHNPISTFKKYYVLRRAKKEIQRAHNFPTFTTLDAWLQIELKNAPIQTKDLELAIALLGNSYLVSPEQYKTQIETLIQWCTQALITQEGQALTKNWTSFSLPERLDYTNLVPTELVLNDAHARRLVPAADRRQRDGFQLTDTRMQAREIQHEINYCIYCHDHEGDFCSRGFPVKKGDPAQGFKKNPLDTTLTGCPLEEKISEMNILKRDGFPLAALAMVMVDNPMCPATGHRICNDCMKACIYQKQTPVNIPQIETRVLTDVLALPFGVEIYDLLTKWNPLRQQQWLMQPYNGLKVLVAGMGPAGFTLAHHLLQEGFAVVGFDGLKIEPLPPDLLSQPIQHFADLTESLDERIMMGFGGVAEYGITVRWDKNFLKLIYLTLARRPYFQVFGGVRFGGTIKVEDAWELGFDHFAIAVGAGLPKALPIPNSLAPGMRQANDFLMALQLGNAAKPSSLTNLQVRLPAVIIGGGLTGVDAATEIQAYYIVQVEKLAARYETLVTTMGEAHVRQALDPASLNTLQEYLEHAQAIKAERQLAYAQKRSPDFIKLIHTWGGVTIVYRRSMQESPAYINNHEELKKALEEGIYYAEGLDPIEVELDDWGQVNALVCNKRIKNAEQQWADTKEVQRLPAKSILVATGTKPNTAYEFEHRGTFKRLRLQYQHFEEDESGELENIDTVAHCKIPRFGPFTSYQQQDKRVSLIGDTHPVFHGSVVKAIASGMRTYPKILTSLRHRLGQPGSETEYQTFRQKIQYLFTTQVAYVTRKTAQVVEIGIRAPLAAKHFKPGHFYRLQNLETHAPLIENTRLQMEPTALIASECDVTTGILNFIVTEQSTATRLCALLKNNEPVSLMGPTGVRTKIPSTPETILIIGTQASFSFVRSYGVQLRQAGHRVIYIGEFKHKEELYCQEQIENATDIAIWLTASDLIVASHRKQDRSYCYQHAIDLLTDQPTLAATLNAVNRIFIIGDTNLLKRFQAARNTVLKNYFTNNPKVFASVYGNMQCMLKGVCAQCLQWQIDPKTGLRSKAVFACSWQDQPLEMIDIDHIDARLAQNYLHEKISKMWLDYLFKKGMIDPE